MPNLDFWMFLAGLGIFLLGINQMELGIKNLAGKSFRRFLRNYTKNPFLGILLGVIVTSILQSSSVVSLMVLAFVGAGIIPLRNAIGIIFGANLGTTITGWIVASIGFKIPIDSFALPLLGIGGVLIAFLGNRIIFNEIGRFLVGFGALFMGLNYMKESIEMDAAAEHVFASIELAPHFFFIIGVIITAVIQSSSATMAIALSALFSGVVSLEIAGAIVIGGYLGTTITVMLGTLGGNQVKRQVAFAHIGFNFITSIIALIFLYPLLDFVKSVLNITDPLYQLVAFHSTFTLIGIVIMLPFIGPYARFLERFVKVRKVVLSPYLERVPATETEGAIEAIRKEGDDLLEKIKSFRFASFNETPKTLGQLFDSKQPNLIDQYKIIQEKEGDIIAYFVQINQEKLNSEDSDQLQELIHAVKRMTLSAKNIKNILHTITFLKETDESEIAAFNMSIQEQFSTFYNHLKTSNNPETVQHQIDQDYRENVNTIYALIQNSSIKKNELTSVLHLNSEIKNFKVNFMDAWFIFSKPADAMD
jgi:phosphate:Na+ symporter